MDELMENASAVIRGKFKNLENIWKELGLPVHQIADRRQACIDHVDHMCDMLVAEETDRKETLIAKNIRYERKIINILAELGTMSQEETSGPITWSPPQVETLLEKERRLEQELSLLVGLKSNRLEKAERLRAKCNALAAEVSYSPLQITHAKFGFGGIPQIDELDVMTSYVGKLTAEKTKRLEELHRIRPKITKLLSDLGDSSTGTFLRKVVTEPEERFLVTDENMSELRRCYEETKNKWNRRVQELQVIRKNVHDLWELMDTPVLYRKEFAEKSKGFRQSDLAAYQKELDHVQTLRLCNLSNLTTNAIAKLTKVRRQARILPPTDENLEQKPSEEFLNVLVKKLSEAKTKLEKRSRVIEMLEDWERKIGELEDLTAKSKEPSRLWNRGGGLLEEERKRKDLDKSLCKVASALKKFVSSWEVTQGQFLIDGVSLDVYKQSVIERKEAESDKKQFEKRRKRRLETENEMTYGSVNPNKTKIVRRAPEIKIGKVDEPSSSSSSSAGKTLLTPWGSMKYSPNKPPPVGDAKLKPTKFTAAALTLKQYVAKTFSTGKRGAKTTDYLETREVYNAPRHAKQRRRSKSLTCLVPKFQPSLLRSTTRLPVPSAVNHTQRSGMRICGKASSEPESSLHANMLASLSETVEGGPPCNRDQSFGAGFASISGSEFNRALADDRRQNSRSSLIPKKVTKQ